MADQFNINGAGNFNRIAASRTERIKNRQKSEDTAFAASKLDKIEFSKPCGAEIVSLAGMKERLRGEIIEELKDEPTVSGALLDQLREQIAAGTYEININEIAKKMLFEVLE